MTYLKMPKMSKEEFNALPLNEKKVYVQATLCNFCVFAVSSPYFNFNNSVDMDIIKIFLDRIKDDEYIEREYCNDC